MTVTAKWLNQIVDTVHNLDDLIRSGKTKFRFRVEYGACESCAIHKNKVYTSDDIKRYGFYPPFHPNCRCKLLPLGANDGNNETVNGNAQNMPLPFVLSSGQGSTKLDTAESIFIMQMQIRLQSLDFLDRNFSAYGYFDRETAWAVREFNVANSALNYVTSQTNYTSDYMRQDAFKAINNIMNDTRLNKHEKETAVAYIEFVIYLQYNTQARKDYENYILSNVR